MSDLKKDVDDLLREVVGDYKNDRDSKRDLNEESGEKELLNGWKFTSKNIASPLKRKSIQARTIYFIIW